MRTLEVFRGRMPSTSKEAGRAAAAVAKLAHRVHAMTGEDLLTWLESEDGQTWAVQTCLEMEALLRAVAAAKERAAARAAAKGAKESGEGGEAE